MGQEETQQALAKQSQEQSASNASNESMATSIAPRQPSLDTRGMMAVALAEGVYLGLVADITLDIEERKVGALRVRSSKGSDQLNVIPWSDITQVGRNVVLVESERALRSPEEEESFPTGTPAAELRGRLVATDHGTHVGNLRDFTIDPSTGHVVGLLFAGGQRLALRSPDEVVFGDDQIVLKAAAAERIEAPAAQEKQEPGFFELLVRNGPFF